MLRPKVQHFCTRKTRLDFPTTEIVTVLLKLVFLENKLTVKIEEWLQNKSHASGSVAVRCAQKCCSVGWVGGLFLLRVLGL